MSLYLRCEQDWLKNYQDHSLFLHAKRRKIIRHAGLWGINLSSATDLRPADLTFHISPRTIVLKRTNKSICVLWSSDRYPDAACELYWAGIVSHHDSLSWQIIFQALGIALNPVNRVSCLYDYEDRHRTSSKWNWSAMDTASENWTQAISDTNAPAHARVNPWLSTFWCENDGIFVFETYFEICRVV